MTAPGGGDARIAREDAALLFRVGTESFAAPLAEVEEAVEVTGLHDLPGAGGALRGVVLVREALVPAYRPDAVLGTRADAPATALVIRRGDTRLAVLVDDVDDVIAVPADAMHAPPAGAAALGAGAGVVRGVVHHGQRLVAVVDVDAMIAALRGMPHAAQDAARRPAAGRGSEDPEDA